MESDRARSPLEKSVIRLDSMPPGQVASSTKPTASGWVGANRMAMPIPMIGGMRSMLAEPARRARRWAKMRLKSCGVRLSPMENIMNQSEPGKRMSSIRFINVSARLRAESIQCLGEAIVIIAAQCEPVVIITAVQARFAIRRRPCQSQSDVLLGVPDGQVVRH